MFVETQWGYMYQDLKHIVFFGKKDCSLENLKSIFSDFQFRSIRQTHSKTVIVSVENSEIVEADAHYTNEFNVALVIRTADCLPIFIYSQQNNIVAAIHAGWRGVENHITLETLKRLPSGNDYKIYIGPHILQENFEVKQDVKDLLLKSAKSAISNVATQKAGNYYIDLQKIVKTQINQVFPQAQVYENHLNTYKNPRFNSFRTDATPQRNLSFVVQKMSPV